MASAFSSASAGSTFVSGALPLSKVTEQPRTAALFRRKRPGRWRGVGPTIKAASRIGPDRMSAEGTEWRVNGDDGSASRAAEQHMRLCMRQVS